MIKPSPEHYQGTTVSAMDAFQSMIEAQSKGMSEMQIVYSFNAFKYLWRWNSKHKGKERLSDINKAIHYLQMLANSVAEEYPIEKADKATLQQTPF